MSAEVLIVDNDPVICALSKELLQEAGFTTQILLDSRQVLSTIKQNRPRAVLMDIMMPGIDGLSLCRRIKQDAETKDIKVIIVTGKTFDVEKERAVRYGADHFIAKPYDTSTFADAVISIVGRPAAPPAGERAEEKTSVLTIWGCRSGGGAHKTPCISIESENHLFVFDAGSGLAPLGEQILKGTKKEIWLFLTHFHPSHIEGLGAFAPLRTAGFKVHIGGPNDPDKTLEDCVRETIQKSYAVNPSPIQAQLHLYEFSEGDYDLFPGARISAFYTNHPTTTLGYCLKTPGSSIVYCPDSELYGDTATALQDYDENLAKQCRDADLLIHDARYNEADHEANKNKGHSSFVDAVDFGLTLGVDHLVLFHQDASYGDQELEAMLKKSKDRVKEKGGSMGCELAREGLSINL